MIYLYSYLAGYLLCLALLSAFGRSRGIDYESRKRNYDDFDYDDWDTNAEAYVVWSLAWPIILVFVFLAGFRQAMTALAQFLIENLEVKEKSQETTTPPAAPHDCRDCWVLRYNAGGASDFVGEVFKFFSMKEAQYWAISQELYYTVTDDPAVLADYCKEHGLDPVDYE